MVKRHELVADSVDGANEDRAIRIDLDFLAQPGNAVIDGAIAGALSFRPRRADQSLARDDDAWACYQELQHLELPQRECHDLIGATELHRLEIEGEISKVRHLNCWH